MKLEGASTLYQKHVGKSLVLFIVLLGLLVALTLYAVGAGSYDLPLQRVIGILLGGGGEHDWIVVWSIRMPRIVASIMAGWGLALAGLVMQTLLKNQLVSPSTLGISQGAAFGAACAIVLLGAGSAQIGALRTSAASLITINNVIVTTVCAFLGAMVTTIIMLLLARIRNMTPQSLLLAGIAISSLFVSGTILIQYCATEVQLASVVFWTFGDVARSNWHEIAIMSASVVGVTIYFLFNQWNLNAVASGDDTAKGLGVDVERLRLWGMLMASLVSALVTAFQGVIAFLGLLAPHIGRKLVGSNHRFLLPVSCVVGSILLLTADTVGRCLIGSGTLPVGVITSFMGAPVFLYLLIGGPGK